MDRIVFLEHVVSVKGTSVDLNKIEVMLDWQRPKIVKEIHNFLGLVGYYRRFFKGFAKLVRPFTTFTKKKTQI